MPFSAGSLTVLALTVALATAGALMYTALRLAACDVPSASESSVSFSVTLWLILLLAYLSAPDRGASFTGVLLPAVVLLVLLPAVLPLDVPFFPAERPEQVESL